MVADILTKVTNSRVIVLGGGDELTLSILKAASDALPGSGAVILDPCLDVKPQQRRQIDELEPTFHETNQSHLRKLITNEIEDF